MSDHVGLREFADRAARGDCGPFQMPGTDPDRRCDSCGQPLPNQARVWLDEINDRLHSGAVTWGQLYDALGVEGPHLHHVLAGMVPLDEETARRLLAAGAVNDANQT